MQFFIFVIFLTSKCLKKIFLSFFLKWSLVISSWKYNIFSYVCNDTTNIFKVFIHLTWSLFLQVALTAPIFQAEDFFKCLGILGCPVVFERGTKPNWDMKLTKPIWDMKLTGGFM